jgi:hypothetical protein
MAALVFLGHTRGAVRHASAGGMTGGSRMNLRRSARVALLLLLVFAASTRAGAQTASADLKDVQLPSGAFLQRLNGAAVAGSK